MAQRGYVRLPCVFGFGNVVELVAMISRAGARDVKNLRIAGYLMSVHVLRE